MSLSFIFRLSPSSSSLSSSRRQHFPHSLPFLIFRHFSFIRPLFPLPNFLLPFLLLLLFFFSFHGPGTALFLTRNCTETDSPPQAVQKPENPRRFLSRMTIDSWPIFVHSCAMLPPVRHQAENAAIKHPVNPLKTKRRPFYLKTQSVPRSKHFSSQL